jgi:hypothetical protein
VAEHQKGRSIKIAGDTRSGTVADLFDAYVTHLKASDKSPGRKRRQQLIEASKPPRDGVATTTSLSAALELIVLRDAPQLVSAISLHKGEVEGSTLCASTMVNRHPFTWNAGTWRNWQE